MNASIWTPVSIIFTYDMAWNYKTAEDGDIVIEVHAVIDTRAQVPDLKVAFRPSRKCCNFTMDLCYLFYAQKV